MKIKLVLYLFSIFIVGCVYVKDSLLLVTGSIEGFTENKIEKCVLYLFVKDFDKPYYGDYVSSKFSLEYVIGSKKQNYQFSLVCNNDSDFFIFKSKKITIGNTKISEIDLGSIKLTSSNFAEYVIPIISPIIKQ